MNGLKQIAQIETIDQGHVLLHVGEDDTLYLTVAGTSATGKPLVAYVVLDNTSREQLRRALGDGFLETGK